MSRWTKWRKIANKKEYFDRELDHVGPATYEIGIRKKGQKKIRIQYIGETNNERRRMKQYGRNGSHIAHKIDKALNDGYELFYRGQTKPSKAKAEIMEKNLLQKFKYKWNTQHNK